MAPAVLRTACSSAPNKASSIHHSIHILLNSKSLSFPRAAAHLTRLASRAATAMAATGAPFSSAEVRHQHEQQQQHEQERDLQQGRKYIKKELRQQLKKQLRALNTQTMQQQSSQISQHVLRSCFFKDARSVGLYVTCERLREVDTGHLLQEALHQGKHVFIPLVEDQSSNMSMLHIDSLQDMHPAPPFGILEPSRQHPDGSTRLEALEAPYQLDVLLMPGLGFDQEGGRLGRGGGYYDKLVHNLDERAQQQHWHRPWLVALAFSEQLIPEVPMNPHDRHVDVLATPAGLHLCSDRARAHVQQQQENNSEV